MVEKNKLIFEKSCAGRKAYLLPVCDVPEKNIEDIIPGKMLRKSLPNLPELSEIDVVRHFTNLSKMNYGVDEGFYPLGSCTMKYNPKINETICREEGFRDVHPLTAEELSQGSLELMYELDRMLSEITGMAKFSLQPAAGAHGETAGLMIMKAYHEHRGEKNRKKIIIPDSAHGTNPASAAAVGFDVIEVASDSRGNIDIEKLKEVADENTAGLMLTNPSTLGLFEENIIEIRDIIHKSGGLLYYDGANANAILRIVRPGDMGFDIVHLNLHKTFATPHGGGGPGAGPVGVTEKLLPFLPVPIVEMKESGYYLDYNYPLSIGKIKSFYGNFAVLVKAWAYLMSIGEEGLKEISETAIINANYIMERLKSYYELPYDRRCMHEFVLSALRQKKNGVSALNIAKRLIDYGYHPPTIYFPLIVREAMMIEPTETESKETLDEFIEAMISIAKEAEENPQEVIEAPSRTSISRPDEVLAARKPVLRYEARSQMLE